MEVVEEELEGGVELVGIWLLEEGAPVGVVTSAEAVGVAADSEGGGPETTRFIGLGLIRAAIVLPYGV